jgi:hypothetical protein
MIQRMAYKVGWISSPGSITFHSDSRVYTSGIGVPDIDQEVGDWLAGGDVDELEFKVQVNTSLVFCHIAADGFACNPVWALSHLWRENAGGVGGEKERWIGVDGEAISGEMIDLLPRFEIVQGADFHIWLWKSC